MRERNRLLKDMVREPAWYGALEAQMAEAAITIDRNRRAALQALDAALLSMLAPLPPSGMISFAQLFSYQFQVRVSVS